MAEIPIDPITQRRIRAFGQRRRVFAGIRAGLVMLAGLLAMILIIAIIDWLFVTPSGARAVLTIIGYLGSAAAGWFFGLRDVFRESTDEELARFMEKAAPELREDLVSAVELADFDPETVRDSAEFRQLVQEDVASRVTNVETRKLLPWARLKNFAIAAGGALAFAAILAAIVGVGFASRLMMRAAVPGVEIAKYTGVEIQVTNPGPNPFIIRAGDPVDLKFGISNPDVPVANLIIRTEGRERVVKLRPTIPGHFETTLFPKRANIEFEIKAGDAKTETRVIEPHTPPVILGFEKRFEFPSYLVRETQEISERDGHLKAIEGTKVQLTIEADQASTGEIEITMGGEKQTIALTAGEENLLTAAIPITDSGRYQIHLKGARSKLPAEFAPTYQITAHPDKAPRIRLIKPDTANTVQPDAVIPVQAQAEDDFGIARVEQWLSRNGGEEWEKFEVAAEAGRNTPIVFNWDLLKHNLDAGDLITTKLVAFDGRGEFAESREIDLTINFRDLDPARLTGLRARERTFSIIEELMDASKPTVDALKTEIVEGGKAQGLYELDREAWSAMGRLQTPLQSARPGREAYDLNLAARSTAIGRHAGVRQAIRRVPFAKKTREAKLRAELLNSARSDIESMMRTYSGSLELTRAMIGEELAAISLGDFLDLRRQTQLLLPEPEPGEELDAATIRRFSRVLGLTIHRANAITESLEELEVGWQNTQAGKLHDIAETIGPRLESLALDLETLRADDRRARSSVNQLGAWRQLGAIPFESFDEAYHREYGPEVAIELNERVEGKTWREVRDWPEGELRELAKPGTVVYLFRTITANAPNVVETELSCREGITIWVNGEIWQQTHNQRSSSSQRHRLQLRAGQNNLLVKLVNRRHPHPFRLSIENGRVESDVDTLATEADKLLHISRETKSAIDDSIRSLQPVLARLNEEALSKSASIERGTANTRDQALAIHRLVSRGTFVAKKPEDERMHIAQVDAVFWTPRVDALDSFAWLDEARPDSDSQFSRQTGMLARAIEAMRPDYIAAANANPADYDTSRYSAPMLARREVSDRMRAITEAFKLLEASYDIREMLRTLRELSAQESWSSQGPEPRTRHPFEWQFVESRIQMLGVLLSQDSRVVEAGAALLELHHSGSVSEVEREMKRRTTTLDDVGEIRPQLAQIWTELERIHELLEPAAADAIVAIEAESPTLIELMELASKETRKLEQRTRVIIDEIADADETVAFARTRELFLTQQQTARHVRNVMNGLRQDANAQNVLLAEGRERARDTDSALEWLRLPGELSSAAYEDALFAETPREQRHFLEDGGLNQGEISNRIEELIAHFKGLEAGESVAESRQQLRNLEDEFEIRERLDREFGQLERVAEMTQLRKTSDLLSALESELDGNGVMQRELDALTRNAAQDALTNLQSAALSEAAIGRELMDEAIRQGEINPKSEIRKPKSEVETEVKQLRSDAAELREKLLSLRTQRQQLLERREQFEKDRADFLEIELPAIGVQIGNLEAAAASLTKSASDAQKRMREENSDLATLDVSSELAAVKEEIGEERTTIGEEEVPGPASEFFDESLRTLDLAIDRFPVQHAGDLRVATRLYERSNEIRNAAARLEAASERAMAADREVIASTTKVWGDERAELNEATKQLRELAGRMDATFKLAREVGATDARANHDQAKKDIANAVSMIPNRGATLLTLSEQLDELGLTLREAGTEFKRGTSAIRVQIEGPAKREYYDARKMLDNIRRVENQAKSQLDQAVRARAASKRRGVSDEDAAAYLLTAETHDNRAAELMEQAKRMTRNTTGQEAKTKAHMERAAAAMKATEADGKLAQELGDSLRKLADVFEEQIAKFEPRENSDAGRSAKRLVGYAASLNEIATKTEDLALKINPNVHTPSEAEMASRLAEQAMEKAQALLEEQQLLADGDAPEDLDEAIEATQKADGETQGQLAKSEQMLRELEAIERLPTPDPNPERALAAIAKAADAQEPVIAEVGDASGDLLRAALHEHRLGQVINAERIGEVAKSVQELGEGDLPADADRIRAEKKAQSAAAVAGESEERILDEIALLRAILFPEASVEARTVTDEERDFALDLLTRREQEVSEQLARVLFQVQEQIPNEQLMAQLELAEQTARAAAEKDFDLEEPEVSEQVAVSSEQPQSEEQPEQIEETPQQPEDAPQQPEDAPQQP
ncbi:MAG: hypothetical protein AAF585_04285, partial [Verrucomicrobiota bacterium]